MKMVFVKLKWLKIKYISITNKYISRSNNSNVRFINNIRHWSCHIGNNWSLRALKFDYAMLMFKIILCWGRYRIVPSFYKILCNFYTIDWVIVHNYYIGLIELLKALFRKTRKLITLSCVLVNNKHYFFCHFY